MTAAGEAIGSGRDAEKPGSISCLKEQRLLNPSKCLDEIGGLNQNSLLNFKCSLNF